MPECPICGRSYDARFQVFAPTLGEGFDTVACARRAAAAWGSDAAGAAPAVLPVIEVVPPPPAAPPEPSGALAGFVVSPTQAALAAGVGLFAAGTAASVYLWTQATKHAPPVAVAPPAHVTQPPPSPTTPAQAGPQQVRTRRRARAHLAGGSRPGRKATLHRVPPAPTGAAAPSSEVAAAPPAPPPPPSAPASAAQAQYGSYQPPFSASAG